jgi:hypothetical protein
LPFSQQWCCGLSDFQSDLSKESSRTLANQIFRKFGGLIVESTNRLRHVQQVAWIA